MADELWTIKRALAWTEDYLERKGDAHPRLSAQWLMQDATQLSRIQLFTQYEKPLSPEERACLRDYVRRRAAGEPLQYITGSTTFRFVTLSVRAGVLIPRPETEVLVGEALKMLRPARSRCSALGEEASSDDMIRPGDSEMGDEGSAPDALSAEETLRVLDLCTGSGCIACSLAYEHPLVQVFATDISPKAVDLARENAHALGLEDRITVFECDLALGIPKAYEGTFDLVVSNPPYVPHAVLETLDWEVSAFEPALALDGGDDGLEIYRRILPSARRFLKPGGCLAVELHETCLPKAQCMAEDAGYVDCSVVRDLAGKPRVLVARRDYPRS